MSEVPIEDTIIINSTGSENVGEEFGYYGERSDHDEEEDEEKKNLYNYQRFMSDVLQDPPEYKPGDTKYEDFKRVFQYGIGTEELIEKAKKAFKDCLSDNEKKRWTRSSTLEKIFMHAQNYKLFFSNEQSSLLEGYTPSSEMKEKKKNRSNWITYFFFFCQGAGTLLTWNSVINCPDYFLTRFEKYHSSINSVITTVYMAMNTLGVLLMTGECMEWIPFGLLTCVCYISFSLPMCLAFFGMTKGDELFYATMTVLLCGLCGIITAVLQARVFSKANEYSTKEINAVAVGQGFVGIIMAGGRILTKSFLEDAKFLPPKWRYEISVLIYFAVALIGNILCMIFVCFYPFLRQEGDTSWWDYFWCSRKDSSVKRKKKGCLGDCIASTGRGAIIQRCKAFSSKTLENMWVNRWEYAIIFGTFFVTLSIFPGVSSVIQTTTFRGDFDSKKWMSVTLSAIFCVFDFLGRISGLLGKSMNVRMFSVITGSRVLFIPIFIILVNPPMIFANDFIPFLLMAALAFTNGFVYTLKMATRDKSEMELGKDYVSNEGATSTFFIVGGVFIGAAFSILFSFIGEKIPPKWDNCTGITEALCDYCWKNSTGVIMFDNPIN